MLKRLVICCTFAVCSAVSAATGDVQAVKTNRVKFAETSHVVSDMSVHIVYSYLATPVVSRHVSYEKKYNGAVASDESVSHAGDFRAFGTFDSSDILRLKTDILRPVLDGSAFGKEYVSVCHIGNVDVYVRNRTLRTGMMSFDDIMDVVRFTPADVGSYVKISRRTDSVMIKIDDNVVSVDIARFDSYMMNSAVSISRNASTSLETSDRAAVKTDDISAAVVEYGKSDAVSYNARDIAVSTPVAALARILASVNSVSNGVSVRNDIAFLNSVSGDGNSSRIDTDACRQILDVLAYESCNNLANTIYANIGNVASLRIKAKKLQFAVCGLKSLMYENRRQKMDKSVFDFGSVYWQLYREYEDARDDASREAVIVRIQAYLDNEFRSQARKLKIVTADH